jgi:hypothetical protein
MTPDRGAIGEPSGEFERHVQLILKWRNGTVKFARALPDVIQNALRT